MWAGRTQGEAKAGLKHSAYETLVIGNPWLQIVLHIVDTSPIPIGQVLKNKALLVQVVALGHEQSNGSQPKLIGRLCRGTPDDFQTVLDFNDKAFPKLGECWPMPQTQSHVDRTGNVLICKMHNLVVARRSNANITILA